MQNVKPFFKQILLFCYQLLVLWNKNEDMKTSRMSYPLIFHARLGATWMLEIILASYYLAAIEEIGSSNFITAVENFIWSSELISII